MIDFPCEECICLAICISRIERHTSILMVSSLSKKCELLGDYLFGYHESDYESASTSNRIKHAREFYKHRKDKR